MGEISDGIVVVVVLFLFVLAILWFLLPFAIFGTKDKLSELIAETKKTNEQLSERLVRLTAYLASLFNAVISDLKSLNCSFVFLVSAINSLNLSFVPKIANGSKNHKIASLVKAVLISC
jgi:hypothetical protein